MPIVDSQIRQFACDAEGCTKKVIFDRKDERATFETPENAWLKTTRVVQTADGRNFMYCSDACEVKGTTSGKHNMPEPSKVQTAAGQGDINAAVALAKARAEADAALRAGQPGSVQITDGQ